MKYGGQLDFEFGSMPVLDPALKEVLLWEGGNTDFPQGPMYWQSQHGGKAIEAIAVGSVDTKERREKVCTIKTTLSDDADKDGMNGHAIVGTQRPGTRSEFLSASTTTEGAALMTGGAAAAVESETNSNVEVETPEDSEPRPETDQKAVQKGKLVPASRPEPVSFVTASEGLNTFSVNDSEKGKENLSNGNAND